MEQGRRKGVLEKGWIGQMCYEIKNVRNEEREREDSIEGKEGEIKNHKDDWKSCRKTIFYVYIYTYGSLNIITAKSL